MLVRNFFQGSGFQCFHCLMAFETNPADLGGGSENQSTEDQDVSQGQESGYSSFVQELLKDAPQEHVKIMEPYIKKFDAGTTRRFQDLKNQYKHYDSLGWDEETTQQMSEVYRILNEEPETLYEILKEEFDTAAKEQSGASTISESPQEVQGLPPEVQTQIEQQQQILQALAQWVIEQDQAKTQAVEDSGFEEYLGQLKAEYGDFNEKYVLTCISNGMDGEAAVKEWNDMLGEHLRQANSSTEGLPNALLSSAGGGSIPQSEPQNLGGIPDRDIRNLIANVISQTNQAAQ